MAWGKWSEEREALLRKLWGMGLSCSQIAARLGDSSKRSAVIGKVHRLGLPARVGKPGKMASQARSTKIRRKSKPWRHLQAFGLVDKHSPLKLSADGYVPAEEDYIVPAQQRKTLLELKDDSCRFPIGDPQLPDFYFCGGEAVPGKPYCLHHCARAYTVPERRAAKGRQRIEAKETEHA